MFNLEANLESRQSRRMAVESKFIDKRERLESKIEADCMIGELCREGTTLFYFWPAGTSAKAYAESASRGDIIEHIIRNKWVR